MLLHVLLSLDAMLVTSMLLAQFNKLYFAEFND